MTLVQIIALATLALSATAKAEPLRVPEPVPAPLSIDLRDIAKLTPNAFPHAKSIVDALNAEPNKFFTAGHKKVFGTGAAFYGVEILDTPYLNADRSIGVPLIALVNDKRRGYLFRKFEVTVANGKVSLERVIDDISLKDTKFTVRVGLIQRKAILEDEKNGIRKIYPLEVGGFDQARDFERPLRATTLLTPRFEDAYLDRDGYAYQKRDDNPYYYNRPYLPVTNRKGKITDIAFHIIQHPLLDDGSLDFNRMLRGFDSHGCMRLREKDLFELSTVLFKGGQRRIPLDVDYFLSDEQDHPIALDDSKWVRIKYFTESEDRDARSTADHGKHKRKKRRSGDELFVHKDENKLTEIEYVEGSPPLHELRDLKF